MKIRVSLTDDLTLKRSNLLQVYVPVSPNLAKPVKVRSDHSENLTKVLGGAKRIRQTQKNKTIISKIAILNFSNVFCGSHRIFSPFRNSC